MVVILNISRLLVLNHKALVSTLIVSNQFKFYAKFKLSCNNVNMQHKGYSAVFKDGNHSFANFTSL